MRSSAVSQSSRMSTKQIQQTCSEHEGELLTNFCSSISCVKALCPECIESHYQQHKSLRTQPQIDSFKSLKNKCINKVGGIIEKISTNECSDRQDIAVIFESSLRKVKETKEKCRKILESYFNTLEDYMRSKVQKMTGESSEIYAEAERIANIVSQLKSICTQMDNPKTFLHAAETVVKLDAEKIQDKVEEGQNIIRKFKENNKNLLFVEKNYQEMFYGMLSRLAYFGNKENISSKIVEEIMAEERAENIGRGKYHSQHNKTIEISSRNKDRSKDKDFKRQESRIEEDKKSSTSRRSSNRQKREIIGINTFQSNSVRKYLHFFQVQNSILHYSDIDNDDTFQKIPLKLKQPVPLFHKSIALPNGDLYVLGGSLDKGQKSNKIFKFDFQSSTLIYCNSLKYGRSSHSLCFNNRYIYIIGGYTQNQNITSKCERYDIVTNKVQEIRPMLRECCSVACCSFNGRYIYVFDGVGLNQRNTHRIDRYDEKVEAWESIEADGDQVMKLSTSAAVQITKQEIMVMGGYDDNNRGQKQTYIVRVEDNNRCVISDVNVYPLTFAEAFWNNNPIIHRKMVFVLQNVTGLEEEDSCDSGTRRILVFDGLGWKSLN